MPADQPDMHVRPATSADAAAITEFNIALALETEDKRLDPAVVHAAVERGLSQPALCRYFLADLDQRTVGQTMITSEWSDWRGAMFWWIQSVYVIPACRRRGVFHVLYHHVQSLARADADVCGLRLYVDERNQSAMGAYERLGLTRSGHVLYECDWSPT